MMALQKVASNEVILLSRALEILYVRLHTRRKHDDFYMAIAAMPSG
jgi:hypothetical protein